MAKAKPKQTEEDPLELGNVLQSAEEVFEDDTLTTQPKSSTNTTEDDVIPPLMTSPEWSSYVMSQFHNDELDGQGHPTIHGLRRVSRKLLGPILESKAFSVRAAEPPYLDGKRLQYSPVVAGHRLTILWTRTEDNPTLSAYQVTFEELADVTDQNTDPEFFRFPTALAATRAEARNYRKALQINTVSSEEKTELTFEEGLAPGSITSTQLNMLELLARRTDVNLAVYLQMGKSKFKRLIDIPHEAGEAMCQHLSKLADAGEPVSETYRGFKPNWREAFE